MPILNSVHVLRSQLPSDDPIVRQSRDTIERQVLQLKRMVDDLLDVSRIATGKLRLQREAGGGWADRGRRRRERPAT